MNWLSQLVIELRIRIAALVGRDRLRERLDEEMRLHLEMKAERLLDAGLAPEQARSQARRSFGNPLTIRDRALDMWRYGPMERLLQDVRHAARVLARAPGFTSVAVLSLALGIGANTAVFSLMDRVMLRLLPVEAPEELVLFGDRVHPYPRFERFRDEGSDVFSGVLGFVGLTRIGVDGSEDADSFIEGALVSGTYFGVLGVKPVMGRLIGREDDRVPGAHPVIVISHAFWQRHYEGDRGIIGRTLRLAAGSVSSGVGTSGFEPTAPGARDVSSGRFEIIGVAPAGFTGETMGQHPDFWAPLMMQEHFMPGRAWLARATANWVRVMARIRPGVSREQAQARANALYQQALLDAAGGALSEQERQRISEARVELIDGDRGWSRLRGQFAQPLMVLMVMVGVVLLIACANLANLLLARASARAREIALRVALGAGRARIVRQLLTETVLLALAGGVAAVAIAWWGSETMFAMVSQGEDAARLDLAPDARTLAFTAGVAVLAAALFGLAPAIRATRVDLNTTLKEASPSLAARGRLARVLVAAQVALSVLLLIGTGLFTRTLFKMKVQDLGYEPEQIILLRVDPISAGYRGDEIGRICRALLDRIRALPGVSHATFSENGLFSGTESGTSVRVEGFTPSSDRDLQVRFDQVGPGYFTNVGIPLLLGRDFTDADDLAAPRVTIINENMARFYFGDRNPVGQLVHYQGQDQFTLTIVGVAANARDHSLRDVVHRRMYVPFLQPVDGLTGAKYEVRSAVDAAVMARQLRGAVKDVAPRMSVVSVKPLTTLIDESLLRERMVARLAVAFGILAVVLASVGLYGLLAYSVVRRTNEIGIRIAVGAFPGRIVRMILRETAIVLAAGMAVGAVAAVALSRYVSSLLYGLAPTDPITIGGVILLMVAVAAAAAIVPSRRAASIDPVRALRAE